MSVCRGEKENRDEQKNHKMRGREKKTLRQRFRRKAVKAGWFDFLFFVKYG